MLLRLIFLLASALAVCDAGPTRRDRGKKHYMIVMKPGHHTNEVEQEASVGATAPPEALDLHTGAALVTDATIDVEAFTALPSVEAVEEVQTFSVNPSDFMTTAPSIDTTPWAAKLAAAGDPSSTLLPPVDNTVDWHLDRIDQRGLPLNLDYNVTQCGAGVDIYIVDTGIANALPEFEGRALPFHSPADGLAGDVYGHGTFVAALAGGRRHGVAKCATLYDVRVLGADGGGDTVDIVQGLDAVLRRPNKTRRAIVNMSLGGKGRSQIIEWYIAALLADNVLVVAAAGNSDAGDNACTYTPGASDSALTVGALDMLDKMPVWSNTGKCVKVLAPGVDVYSTTADGVDQAWSGTSMAAPIAAGGAALLWSDATTLTARQVFRAVLANGTPNLASTAAATTLPDSTPNLLLFVQFSVARAPSAADLAAGIGGTPLTVCTGSACGSWTFSVGVNDNGILMRSSSGAALVRPFSWSGVRMSVYTMVGVTAYSTASLATSLPDGLYFEGNNRMSIRGGGVRVVIESMSFINDGTPRLYFRDGSGGTWSYSTGALVQLTADQVLWLYSWRGLGFQPTGTPGVLQYKGSDGLFDVDRRYYRVGMPSVDYTANGITYRGAGQGYWTGLATIQRRYFRFSNTMNKAYGLPSATGNWTIDYASSRYYRPTRYYRFSATSLFYSADTLYSKVDGVYYATAANGSVKKFDVPNGASILTVAAAVPTAEVFGDSGWSMDGSTFFASTEDFNVDSVGVSPYEWTDANSSAPVEIDYARYYRPLRYYVPL